MGKEIVYCEVCGDRILEQEFEKTRAITVLNKNYCFNCKDEAVKSITMEDVTDEEIDPEPAPPPSRRPARSGGTRSIPRKGTGVTRKRQAPAQLPPHPTQAHSKAPLLIGGGIGLAAMVLLIIIMATSSENSTPTAKNEPGNSEKTNGNGSSSDTSKAENAWEKLQETIESLEENRDYGKILAEIRRIEKTLRGSKYQAQAVRLRNKYQNELESDKKARVVEKSFAPLQKEIAADTKFLRFAEINKKLVDLGLRAPDGSDIEAIIGTARANYTAGYNNFTQRKFAEIKDQLNIQFELEEYKAVMKSIYYHFPVAYRQSNVWKRSLKPLYDRCTEKTNKK